MCTDNFTWHIRHSFLGWLWTFSASVSWAKSLQLDASLAVSSTPKLQTIPAHTSWGMWSSWLKHPMAPDGSSMMKWWAAQLAAKQRGPMDVILLKVIVWWCQMKAWNFFALIHGIDFTGAQSCEASKEARIINSFEEPWSLSRFDLPNKLWASIFRTPHLWISLVDEYRNASKCYQMDGIQTSQAEFIAAWNWKMHLFDLCMMHTARFPVTNQVAQWSGPFQQGLAGSGYVNRTCPGRLENCLTLKYWGMKREWNISDISNPFQSMAMNCSVTAQVTSSPWEVHDKLPTTAWFTSRFDFISALWIPVLSILDNHVFTVNLPVLNVPTFAPNMAQIMRKCR